MEHFILLKANNLGLYYLDYYQKKQFIAGNENTL